MKVKSEDIKKGVEDAFLFWTSDRCITTENAIRAGVCDAVREWLKENTELVKVAINSVPK